MHKKIKYILIFILTLSSSIFANKLIDINKTSDDLMSSSYIYIDNTNSETIETIKNKEFKRIDNSKPKSFGYSPNFTVWIKLTLINTSDEIQKRILEYESSLTTHINFYYDGKVLHEGLFQISPDRNTLEPVFIINLKEKEYKTYYLQLSSKITTLIVNYKLYDLKSFFEKEVYRQNILVFFFTAMFILAAYNLVIYFIVKSSSYLFYVFYILGISLHQFFYTGYSTLFIQDPVLVESIIKGASLIVAIPIFFFSLFTISFTNTKENHPTLYKYLRVYLYLYPLIIFLIVYLQEQGWIRNIFSALLLLLVLLLTLYSVLKRNRQSYFLLLGWIIFFCSMISMYLASAGVYNIYNDIPYMVELFLVLEGLIFSIALADRIKILELEKNKVQLSLIKYQENETIRLKSMVDEKTEKLQSALQDKEFLLKELNHRVKNNMQTIISLIRLQKDSIKDPKMSEMLISIQNRLNAMSEVHQLLYSSHEDLSFISPTEYFISIVNGIKETTYSEDIIVNYDIKSYLKTEEVLYCGLIINELVTNCIKHAFTLDEGEIFIKFHEEKDKKILEVIDNGIGFPKNAKESFGMDLMRSLVELYLKGNIEIINNNGTHITITWY
ncbi:7TM diverse intracellular signaling domain-containing protein [Halarcobacter sp.]|uniref:7TM diverse intracellular signaling domain-containing protein n=1 Tax=Halarcobacter sp. TaxID=2321133 RepID=UPI0029F566CD|nr:7TM diverse intracellular signaling domain-containing protein [Halarcobacter sp.]